MRGCLKLCASHRLLRLLNSLYAYKRLCFRVRDVWIWSGVHGWPCVANMAELCR